MASQGPNSPSTSASQDYAGTADIAWSSPGGCQAQDDNPTSASTLDLDQVTEGLQATNFGFSIPSGATIDGIVVEIDKWSDVGDVIDNSVRLIKGGTVSGTDKGAVGAWATSDTDTYTSYGGATDLWGLTWTDSDINASNFGVELIAQEGGTFTTPSAFVDHIRITVYYTAAAAGTVAQLSILGVGP